MKLSICIPTYNRNESLKNCISSINKIINKKKIKINIIITDNSNNDIVLKIKKKLINISKYKIIFLKEKKRGAVYARNKFLKKIKNINPDYICFFDDDCTIDKYWIKNTFKIIDTKKADVVTGPQLYIGSLKRKIYNYSQIFEKEYWNSKTQIVNWAASNNVMLDYKIIKKNKIFFDHNLNKFGVGEDQLFFLNISKIGYKIFWNKDIKVYEKIHKHRQNYRWLIERSYRLGVLGHYIDIKQSGFLMGLILNYIKSAYYLLKFITSIFDFKKNYLEMIINYFIRFYGRLIGPIIFKKIDFYKK